MFTENQPDSEAASSTFSSANNAELFTQVQAAEAENGVPSPERQRVNRESLTVTYLNTSFSGAFDHPEGLDKLLLQDQKPHENAIFGFSEITQDQRLEVAAKLASRGYEVVVPPDDSHLDLMWAVGPGLEVESADTHHFPRHGIRRFASRRSSKGYRHVGMQDVTVVTSQGNKVRLAQERLSPWVIEPVRRKQVKDMSQVLQEQFPPDDDVLLTINGGDQNHVAPFRKPDDQLWGQLAKEGWKPMLEPGTATHTTVDKYPRVSKAFNAIGRDTDGQQLDAVYTRPGAGTELVDTTDSADVQLQPDQIGYTTRTMAVEGTDHFAVETTFSLPQPSARG